MVYEDTFGDEPLVNDAIIPAPHYRRKRPWQQMPAYFGAVVCMPAIVAFGATHRDIAAPAALAGLTTGLGCAALVATFLGRPAMRFGIGYVGQARAALGPRGANIILLVRWLVGVMMLSAVSIATASWCRKLIVFSVAHSKAAIPLRHLMFWRLPGSDVTYLSWLIAGLFLFLAWGVAQGGIKRIRKSVVLGLGLAFVSGTTLVVLAATETGTVLHLVRGGGRLDVWIIARSAIDAWGLAIPGVIVCADWLRVSRRKHVPLARAVVAPMAMVPTAVLLAASGVMVAAAAQATLGKFNGEIIADAAAFAHLRGGGLGVLMGLGLWLASAPLIGFYGSGLCLCGIWPRRATYTRAVHATWIASLMLIPIVGYAPSWHLTAIQIAWIFAPILGVLLADEYLVRRGRLYVEEPYLIKGMYGPVGGATLAGIVALLAGWCIHPLVLRWLIHPMKPPWDVFGVLVGMVVSAAFFAALVPLERKLLKQQRVQRPAAKQSTTYARPKDGGHLKTGTYFTYGKKNKRQFNKK